ncbi:Thromboxane-A synthase [Rhizophlyctis rosea]|uniref:Thromboxane-A synthase n=1 Tax=Rhizophlyctis rosea TaxID=64517 RepID=A0AAD5SLG5_9FUNG|nr:Thromboxane-A synthase [Rhizophlyctis rosea]
MFWRSSGISEQSPTLAQATSYLKGIVTEVIREKRAAKEKGVTSGRRDLLDQMMDKDFDDTELFEEVVGFFLAGHETTSNTLMYTVLELCRNPDVHAKLQREISTILPHKESPLTLDNLKDFKYLEQVIKEAQRLHTVVGVVGRNAAKDMKIMGYDIEAGTNINIPIKHIHLDERYWPEPQKFDPERFAEGRAAPVPGSYLPFSDGPHNCIGSKLAFIEAKVVLIQLLRQFDVELIPGQTFKYKNGVTTTLENGVRVKLGLKNKGCDDNFGVQSVVEE